MEEDATFVLERPGLKEDHDFCEQKVCFLYARLKETDQKIQRIWGKKAL